MAFFLDAEKFSHIATKVQLDDGPTNRVQLLTLNRNAGTTLDTVASDAFTAALNAVTTVKTYEGE